MEDIINEPRKIIIFTFRFFSLIYFVIAIAFAFLMLGGLLSGSSNLILLLIPLGSVVGFLILGFGIFTMEKWILPLVVAQSIFFLFQFLVESLNGDRQNQTIFFTMLLLNFIFIFIACFAYFNKRFLKGRYFDYIFSTIVIIAMVAALPSFLTALFALDKTIIQRNNPQNNSPQSQLNETDNWKEYVNNEYGFKLQYPNDWDIENISHTYNGIKNPAVNIVSKARYDLPRYTTGVKYLLQLFFYNGKTIINHNGFIKFDQVERQFVEDISLTDSFFKNTQEYKYAQKIIKSVICSSPLVCALPKELLPITDEMITEFLAKPNRFSPNPTIKEENGIYIIDRGELEGTQTIAKIIRADLDSDSREDAIVLMHSCGASCSYGVDVMLNKKNGIVITDSPVPLNDKYMNVRLENNLIFVELRNITGEVDASYFLKVEGNKLVIVPGG